MTISLSMSPNECIVQWEESSTGKMESSNDITVIRMLTLRWGWCYEQTFFIFLLIYYPKKDLARSGTELGHRTKNEVTMWTQHHTALLHYRMVQLHYDSHVFPCTDLYLQRDTNTSSYKNPVHNTTWPPAKCWSILLLQQCILVSHLWLFPSPS